MIYLFEDRKGRQELYQKEKIEGDFLINALLDCNKLELTSYLTANFSNAKAVLFHSSYTFSDKQITKEDVKEFFVEKKIPFVYFSGGLNNNIFIERGILNANVNSGDMYNNIHLFINEFKNNHLINVSLLVYGEKYLLNSLLELQDVLNYNFFEKSNDYILEKNDYDEIIDLVDARIKEIQITEDKSKLIDWLKKEMEKLKLNKITLLSQIQKLIEKY